MLNIDKKDNILLISIKDPQERAESDIDCVEIDGKNKKIVISSLSNHEKIEYSFKSKESKNIINYLNKLDKDFNYQIPLSKRRFKK